MPRYAFNIDYNGKDYHGWQRQPNATSVQAEIEEHLTRLFAREIEITGCGRTDTGVHAKHYVFHADIESLGKLSLDDIAYKLNRMLPASIFIREITQVADDFHARFEATYREYEYRLALHKDVFKADTVFQYTYESELDLAKLNQLNQHFLDAEDFTAFSKMHGGNYTGLCDMMVIGWEESGDGYLFRVRANRFLRGMVRLTVGAYLNYHRGKLTEEDIIAALRHQTPLPIHWSVPAHGLTFCDAGYPNLLAE